MFSLCVQLFAILTSLPTKIYLYKFSFRILLKKNKNHDNNNPLQASHEIEKLFSLESGECISTLSRQHCDEAYSFVIKYVP